MPNVVVSRITASPETLAAIGDLLRSDDQPVDFNRLAPMPECLDVGTYAPILGDRARACLLSLAVSGGEAYGPPPIDLKDKDFETLVTYMRNIRQTGHAYWGSWCLDHWGTSSNAYHVSVGAGAIQFETSWRAPDRIVERLAEAVPDPWVWEYASDDIGNLFGIWTCRGGTLSWSEPSDAVQLTCRLHGWDHEWYVTAPEGESRFRPIPPEPADPEC